MLVEVKKAGKEERVMVTSLDVAETFGKEHKNVLRDIETLGCSEEFNQLNFEPIKYREQIARSIYRKRFVASRVGA